MTERERIDVISDLQSRLDLTVYSLETRIGVLEHAHAALALRLLNLIADLNGMPADDIARALTRHAADLDRAAPDLMVRPDERHLAKRLEDAAHHLDSKVHPFPEDWPNAMATH